MSGLMVSHGKTTHPAGAECTQCAEVQAAFEKARHDADENMFGREMKTPCYVTFYTAQGYAIRETMVSFTMNHMDGRLHAQINRKAKELGAHHWAIFKHWISQDVPYTEDELEALL